MNIKVKAVVTLFCFISLLACTTVDVELEVTDIYYLGQNQITARSLEDYNKHNDLVRINLVTSYDIDMVRKSDGYITQFFVYECRDVKPEALIDSGDYESVLSVKKLEPTQEGSDASSFSSYEIISTLAKSAQRSRNGSDVVDVCIFSRVLNMSWVKSLSKVNRMPLTKNY